MIPTTKSPSVILLWLPIALPRASALVEIHTVHFSGGGGGRGSVSCAQCSAYLVYCVRNKQPARSQGRSTYIFETNYRKLILPFVCVKKILRVKTFCGIDQCSPSAAVGRGTY